eukprot:6210032-Pleurochrysis_carterae.AAC.4
MRSPRTKRAGTAAKGDAHFERPRRALHRAERPAAVATAPLPAADDDDSEMKAEIALAPEIARIDVLEISAARVCARRGPPNARRIARRSHRSQQRERRRCERHDQTSSRGCVAAAS